MIQRVNAPSLLGHKCIGVDPGEKSPGFFLLNNEGPSKFSDRPFVHATPCDASTIPVFCEGQYARPKSSRRSLMVLSFYAGLQAGYYMAQGHPVYILTPQMWREVLLKGSATTNKTVFHNRMRKAGRIPDEVWAQNGDVIDAYLIAVAGEILFHRGDLPKPQKWRA